ncbi:MAG: ABC transporter ATP-binding protein [Coriobacteriia bacterium]|nr:ABC transporter ATP-binding protein [Coriobacteriia bacterium]
MGRNNHRKTTASGQSVTRRTLHYYWQATKNHGGFFAGLMVSTFAYIALLSYGNPLVMSMIIDRVSESPVTADQVFAVFGPYILLLLGVNVVGQAASKLQDYTLYKLEIGVSYDLATMSFDALCNQSMNFHANRFGGTLVSQTSKFMSGYNLMIETLNWPFMAVFASIVSTYVVLLPTVPQFVGILTVLLVVYGAVSYYMYKRILSLNEQAAGAQNQLSGELSDSVANILAVKTYGREDYERTLFDQANREVVARDSKRMRSSLVRGIVTAAITVVIMGITAVFITGGNAWFGITPGTLVVMFTYTYNITNQFNFINAGLQRFNRAFGDASGMTQVLDEPRLVADTPGAQDLQVTQGMVEFRNVGFSYEEEGHITQVFQDFNLSVPAGQRVGLVGRSGSGKSTLVSLLLRLSDLQAGEILVDGQNVAHTTQVSLRRQIAFVPQEPLLFHRTIRENIAYGRPDATQAEIEAAARDANALEFIDNLPQGFETLTGERGVKLSGGQRQRVAIARALLADRPILVLDEATSALDSESEHLVQEALQRLMKGRTCLVVAHRLSTVAGLDRIVVLSDGRVVEDGTHDQLKDAGGEYEHLWDRQTGAFLGEEAAE